MNLLPLRRWLRFSLGSLLLVITLASVWLGWWRQRALQQQAAVAALTKHGGWCYYDYQIVNNQPDPQATSPIPRWLLDQLGDDYFHPVVEVNFAYGTTRYGRREGASPLEEALCSLPDLPRLKRLLMSGDRLNDAGLQHVGKLPELKEIYLWDATNVTDAGMAHLRGLQQLEYVHCSNSQITDESLRVFAMLPRVNGLSLQGSAFTDRGLLYLQNMVQLKTLCVGQLPPGASARKPITNAGLQHLRKLNKLELLDLQATQVTPEGLAALSQLTSLKELWAGNTAILQSDLKTLQAKLPLCQLSADERAR